MSVMRDAVSWVVAHFWSAAALAMARWASLTNNENTKNGQQQAPACLL
jgi:hypothetical protein